MKNLRLPYHQLAANAFGQLLATKHTLFDGELGHAMSALVWLRVSQINGCHFCIDKHGQEALQAGESAARIEQLAHFRDSALFTPAEKAAFAFAEAVTTLEDRVPDAVFLPLKDYYSDRWIAELTVTVGFMNALNRIAITMRQ